ncbi:HlyD family type I secretion periplasmic adaptor subunit [Neptunomonas sp.]|uniref:HlyD family type I secretion periplasmic adaptor subunit n=1 Tax=Neptunomonas sp. TaxID=1971898 RepID=UPI0025F881DD|nr:HlyD family type I secretion periplasmic adaptor subunit [Neptunomonas sp.]
MSKENQTSNTQPIPSSMELGSKEVVETTKENDLETVEEKLVLQAKPPTSMSSVPPPPEKADVPTNDGSYVKFGLVFLLVTLGFFSAWATLAPLSSALLSSGEVVVSSYRKSIQHFEGGIVNKIYVRNGDIVNEGDPLIQLETVQSESKHNTNKKRLYTTQAELERLLAEQSFDKDITFSEVLLNQSQSDQDIKNAINQQKQLYTARLKAFEQESKTLGTRIKQTRQQITGLHKQRSILLEQTVSLQKEQKAFDTLFNEGLADGQRARELNRSILSTQNEISRLESETSRLKIQITETNLQIATRKQDYLKDIGERIKRVQADYYDFKEGLEIAADRLNRTTIRSPERGIVVDLKVHTVGSVVNSGHTLLDLVPEQDAFTIEAKLMTQDINEVYLGQKADIRFSAFNAKITKVIEGEVINVSADRLLNKRDDTPYYMVRLRVTDNGLKDLTTGMELKPGMPAEVMIRRGERTLFSYLLKPIADSFARSFKEK